MALPSTLHQTTCTFIQEQRNETGTTGVPTFAYKNSLLIYSITLIAKQQLCTDDDIRAAIAIAGHYFPK